MRDLGTDAPEAWAGTENARRAAGFSEHARICPRDGQCAEDNDDYMRWSASTSNLELLWNPDRCSDREGPASMVPLGRPALRRGVSAEPSVSL